MSVGRNGKAGALPDFSVVTARGPCPACKKQVGEACLAGFTRGIAGGCGRSEHKTSSDIEFRTLPMSYPGAAAGVGSWGLP